MRERLPLPNFENLENRNENIDSNISNFSRSFRTMIDNLPVSITPRDSVVFPRRPTIMRNIVEPSRDDSVTDHYQINYGELLDMSWDVISNSSTSIFKTYTDNSKSLENSLEFVLNKLSKEMLEELLYDIEERTEISEELSYGDETLLRLIKEIRKK